MRPSFVMLAAALLGAGACSQLGIAGNEAADAATSGLDREAGELAMVTIVRAPDGSCSARLNGQPVAAGAFEDRAYEVVRTEVERIGGPQNLTSDIRAVFEAPDDAPYACFMQPLDTLPAVGFSQIALRPAGRGPGADRIIQVHFASPGETPRPYAELGLRADGSVLWGGQPITPALLREQMTRTVVLPPDGGVTDGSVVIAPEPDATFAQLRDLVGTIMEGGHTIRLRSGRDEAGGPAAGENAQAPTP